MPRQHRRSAEEIRQERHMLPKWGLPISPVAVVLGVVLVIAIGAAWYFEGRHELSPAQAARQLVPYRAEDIHTLEVITPLNRASFSRGVDGRFEGGEPLPTPTPEPAPGGAPSIPPVTFSPGARAQSVVTQLTSMQVDRVLLTAPSASPEYGLDKPQMSFTVETRRGQEMTLAIGGLNPDQTAYYVRREQQQDTVLVSRYTLDEVIRITQEMLT
jgi:hypothetical protein